MSKGRRLPSGLKKSIERANKLYPPTKKIIPKWEAVFADFDTPWYRLIGLHDTSYCVIRHRDLDTDEILNRPILAAGPLPSFSDAEETVLHFRQYGEPK